jgi:hypothetical protein
VHARRRGPVCALAAVAAVTVLGACGGSSAESEPAGSRPAAALENVPKYPESVDRWGVVRGDNGILTQSFVVQGAEPERIASWFDNRLRRRGWVGVDGAAITGKLALRHVFAKERRVLVLAIASAPVVSQTPPFDRVTSKYSFVLYPAETLRFLGAT